MFQPNPNLVTKLTPPPRPLTTDFVNDWAGRLYSTPGVDGKRRQAIVNYVEAIGRLTMRSELLSVTAGFFASPTFVIIPANQNQHEVYDLYEGYFQGFYKTLSSLAAITAMFPKVFNDLPFSSMEKFLREVGKAYPIVEPAVDLLEQARKYRTLLDHPANAAASDWISFRTVDGRGLRIIFFGPKSNSGNIPKGSEAVTFPFPKEADWIFDAPFAPFVNQALRDVTDVLFEKLVASSDSTAPKLNS